MKGSSGEAPKAAAVRAGPAGPALRIISDDGPPVAEEWSDAGMVFPRRGPATPSGEALCLQLKCPDTFREEGAGADAKERAAAGRIGLRERARRLVLSSVLADDAEEGVLYLPNGLEETRSRLGGVRVLIAGVEAPESHSSS